MVVMQHQIEYSLNNTGRKTILNSLVIGQDSRNTAMAKTVGLPVGIASKLILEKQVHATGVTIPVEKYFPALNLIYDIQFNLIYYYPFSFLLNFSFHFLSSFN